MRRGDGNGGGWERRGDEEGMGTEGGMRRGWGGGGRGGGAGPCTLRVLARREARTASSTAWSRRRGRRRGRVGWARQGRLHGAGELRFEVHATKSGSGCWRSTPTAWLSGVDLEMKPWPCLPTLSCYAHCASISLACTRHN